KGEVRARTAHGTRQCRRSAARTIATADGRCLQRKPAAGRLPEAGAGDYYRAGRAQRRRRRSALSPAPHARLISLPVQAATWPLVVQPRGKRLARQYARTLASTPSLPERALTSHPERLLSALPATSAG